MRTDETGCGMQLHHLRPGAPWIHEAILDSLTPRLSVKIDERRRIAFDTTRALCAAHPGECLAPNAIERIGPTLAACFAPYGDPDAWASHTLTVLGIFYRDGLDVPDLAGPRNSNIVSLINGPYLV